MTPYRIFNGTTAVRYIYARAHTLRIFYLDGVEEDLLFTFTSNATWFYVLDINISGDIFNLENHDSIIHFSHNEKVKIRVSCSNYSYSNYSNSLRYSNLEYFWPNIRTIRIPKNGQNWQIFRQNDPFSRKNDSFSCWNSPSYLYSTV